MANLSLLTPREMEVLLLLFAGPNKPFRAEEICISEKILIFYLDYVRTKLNIEARSVQGVHAVAGLQKQTETREIPRPIADIRRL